MFLTAQVLVPTALAGSQSLLDTQFDQIDLGYEAVIWFPVDIEGDGAWELALEVAGDTRRFGVFDPRAESWLDGPRALPVSTYYDNEAGQIGWGVGDWDGDGAPEYVYIETGTNAVHEFDPGTDVDRVLWSTDYLPKSVTVWGQDASGNPTLALRETREVVTGDEYGTTRRIFEDLNVYRLEDGTDVTSLAGAPSLNRMLYGYASVGGVSLTVHSTEFGTYEGATPDHAWIYQDLNVVGPDWQILDTYDLPDKWELWPMFDGQWCLRSANVCPPGADPDSKLWWLTGPSGGWGGMVPLAVGAHSYGSAVRDWQVVLTLTHPYQGIASFDLNGDGSEELYLTLRDGSGWERRNPLIGTILDTIAGLPTTDLYTGPMSSAGHRSLFFVAGSDLFLTKPDMMTAVGDEASAQLLPTRLTLTAAPNPFNAAVLLDWSATESPQALEIYNVLGQRVRTFDLSGDGISGTLTWDGRDQSGRSLASGVYLARLVSGSESTIVKLVLLK